MGTEESEKKKLEFYFILLLMFCVLKCPHVIYLQYSIKQVFNYFWNYYYWHNHFSAAVSTFNLLCNLCRCAARAS